VFVTKYRRKILGDLHHQAFSRTAASVCRDFGATLRDCNGESDHVHLLIDYPPSVQLTRLINSLKAVTSRRMRREFSDLAGAYSKPVLWSRSYFVSSCGGAPLEVIKSYIQNQQG
jgi:putative transposase